MAAKVTSGPNVPFFVSYGEEDYYLDQDLGLARTWGGRVPMVIDASIEALDDNDLVKILEMPNEDDSPRTVIVEEAQKVKESKGKSKPLREYADSKSVSDLRVVLVAIVRGSKLPEMWSHLAAKGKLRERQKLKTYESNNEVIKDFIPKHAISLGLVLDKDVDRQLFQLTGGNLYAIRNELRKLHLLVGNSGKVTIKHLALITTNTSKTEPWDVASAAFARNQKEAMNSLSRVYRTMGEEASVPIVSGLMRELQKTIVAKHLLKSDMPVKDIAGVLGVPFIWCRDTLLPNARKHDEKTLASLMTRLCRLDADVKGPSRSKRTLVELAVLSIAGQ
jgi:DNA polymerase III delta subunit